eukprot:50800_1
MAVNIMAGVTSGLLIAFLLLFFSCGKACGKITFEKSNKLKVKQTVAPDNYTATIDAKSLEKVFELAVAINTEEYETMERALQAYEEDKAAKEKAAEEDLKTEDPKTEE